MKKNLKIEQSLRKNGGSAFCKKISSVKYKGYKLLFLSFLILGICFLYATKIGCVWNYFLGIPCPGCGMTRALIALLHGDVKTSLKYHFMLFSVPILFLYILFDGHLFKNKTVNVAVLSAIALGFLIKWILSLLGI